MCHRIGSMGLCRVEKGVTYALDDFRTAQLQQLAQVAGHLGEFRELVKQVTKTKITKQTGNKN